MAMVNSWWYDNWKRFLSKRDSYTKWILRFVIIVGSLELRNSQSVSKYFYREITTLFKKGNNDLKKIFFLIFMEKMIKHCDVSPDISGWTLIYNMLRKHNITTQ